MVKKLYNQFTCSKMMLPEHRRELVKSESERNRKETCRMPELDEQKLEEFERVFQWALEEALTITVTIMTDKGPIEHVGILEKATGSKIHIKTGMKLEKVEKNRVIELDCRAAQVATLAE